MISEFGELIFKKNPTQFIFDEEMANTGGKLFLLTTNLYKYPKDSFLLGRKNYNLEGREEVDPEGVVTKKQEQKTTNKISTQKN